MKTTVRFEVLDAWRGIAALLVAVFHFNALHHAAYMPFVRNSYLFVDFFFVLSGFVIAHAYADRLDTVSDAAVFTMRRFGRVWPLHVAVLSAFAVFECQRWLSALVQGLEFVPFNATGAVPRGDLAYQITMTHVLGFASRLTWNGPNWSISAEFWTYVIFAAVSVVAPVRWRTAVLAILGAGSGMFLIARSSHGMDVTLDLGLSRCIFGFATGIMVYEFRQATSSKARWANGATEIAAVAMVAGYVSYAGHSDASFLAPFVFASKLKT